MQNQTNSCSTLPNIVMQYASRSQQRSSQVRYQLNYVAVDQSCQTTPALQHAIPVTAVPDPSPLGMLTTNPPVAMNPSPQQPAEGMRHTTAATQLSASHKSPYQQQRQPNSYLVPPPPFTSHHQHQPPPCNPSSTPSSPPSLIALQSCAAVWLSLPHSLPCQPSYQTPRCCLT